MAEPVYAAGKNASVRNPTTGLVHSFDEWEVDGEVGRPEVTNFRTAPYQSLLTGIFSGTVTLTGPKDLSGDDQFTLGETVILRLYYTTTIYVKVTGIVGNYRLTQKAKDAARAQLKVYTTGSLSVPLTVDGQTVG